MTPPRRDRPPVTQATVGDSDGFERAFDELVREHYPRLATFAYRYLRSRELAEDAVQEVLLKVWQRVAHLDFTDPLPYLYQAVRNQCLMVIRHRQRWRTTGLDSLPYLGVKAETTVEERELREAVDEAIASLPERRRLIFTMSREQDLTYAEIARILGISIKTVETQMDRALKALRRRLGRFLTVIAILLSA